MPAITRAVAVCAAALVFCSDALAEVSDFSVSPGQIAPGETAIFFFRSTEDGEAILRIFGPDWRPVAEIAAEDVRAAGRNRIEWNGTGPDGAPVPDEAYFATLEVFDETGGSVELDASLDRAMGEVLVQDTAYDAQAGGVRFTLAVPARVTILAGIEGGGPLMNTLVAARPYPAGTHLLPWDGMDQSGVVAVSEDPDFRLFVSGREVVGPAVIVSGSGAPPYHAFTQRLEQEGLPRKEGVDIDTFGGAPHLLPKPIEVSPEPVFSLSVPDAERGDDGVARVSGEVPLTVSLDDEVRTPILARRFEIVLFQNYEFTTEIEEGRSPATIVWDATRMPPGRYLVTVNVATLPGQMSAASTYVDLVK